MKVESDSHLEWKTQSPTESKIGLGWNMSVDGFLQSSGRDGLTEMQIAEEIQHKGDGIRRELHDILVLQLLPQAISETGVPTQHEKTSTKAKWSAQNSFDFENRQTELAGTQRSQMEITLSSDREINPIAALHNSRASIAFALADSFLFSLQQRFLGIESRHTNSEFSLKGDRVEKFNVQDQVA